MRSLFLALIFLPVFVVFLMGFLVWPRTYLSKTDISFWPKPVVRYLLDRKNTEEVMIKVDNKKVSISRNDLGIKLDVKKTMEPLNISSVSDLINKWITSKELTIIQPAYFFDEEFDRIAIEKLPKKALLNEKYKYDERLGYFDYKADERKSRIDTVDLQAKLITITSWRNDEIDTQLIEETSDLEKRVDRVNKNLKNVHGKPLELVVQGINRNILLGKRDILNLTKIESKDLLNTVDISVKKDEITKILASNGVNTASTDWMIKSLNDNLSERFSRGVLRPVVLGVDSGPNTDGTLAEKYVEVDLSQQRMFFFENGNLFKTYVVSTGLNYPTPVGSYKIKNKLEIGYSGIFNVWMPWWMAFEYRDDIGAYLGIHELPYRLTNGEKIYRFGNYIGSRKTGGCIALSPGEAKEVYDRSFPGMDVVIYQ